MNPYVISQAPLVLGFALLLIVASFRPHQKESLSGLISIVALGATAVCMWFWPPDVTDYFGGAIHVTPVGRVLAYICLALTAGAMLLSDEYLNKIHVTAVDWRMVVLAVGMGMVNLCLAGDLPTLFIAYELVSIPSYLLAGFSHRDPRSNEAGMKYLLLGAFSSVLFLLGLSFVYGATGETNLLAIHDKLAAAVSTGAAADLVLAKVGLALILGAVFFKVGVAPFHTWLPDVYQGSNLASLAVIASPVKVAVFGMLGMLLWGAFEPLADLWKPVLLCGAAISAVMGNLQGIRQTSMKRLVAFSAVVNAGFILLGIMAHSATVVIFYLGSYGIMSLGTWAAFMAMGTPKADVDELSDLTGLGRNHKWLALAMTIILLSFAGIPLTSGFAAKFGVLLEALRPDMDTPRHTVQVLLLSVVGGLISFYFYFQIVRAMWIEKPESRGSKASPLVPELRWNYVFVLAMSVVVIISLGMFLRLPGL